MQIKQQWGTNIHWVEHLKSDTDNTKCWWGRGAMGPLTHGCKMAQPLWRTNLRVSYKPEHAFTMQSSNCAPWHFSKWGQDTSPHRILHTNIYSSFICNRPSLEAAKMPFSRWTNKRVHPDNGILFANEVSGHEKTWLHKNAEGVAGKFCRVPSRDQPIPSPNSSCHMTSARRSRSTSTVTSHVDSKHSA